MHSSRTKTFTIATAAAVVLLLPAVSGCHRAATPPVTPPTPRVVVPVVRRAPPPPRTGPSHQVVTNEWVAMPVRILFPRGGSRLDDMSRAMLRELHATASHRTDIVRISVEGHADSRGSEQANERLGMERAQGVVDFLVGELGMPRELFEVHTFGDDRPLTSCTNAADCLQNRRVEFRILVRRTSAS